MRLWGQSPHDGITALIRSKKDQRPFFSAHIQARHMSIQTPGEQTFLEEAPHQEWPWLILWFWTSHSPDQWEIHARCLTPPACRILLYQCDPTKAAWLLPGWSRHWCKGACGLLKGLMWTMSWRFTFIFPKTSPQLNYSLISFLI